MSSFSELAKNKQRTTGGSFSSMVNKPLDLTQAFPATQNIIGATSILQQRQQQGPTEQEVIARDTERGTTISQGQGDSPLRRAASRVPGNFEQNVYDPIARVASFIFPTPQDYMREVTEADPNLSDEEFNKRVQELMEKDMFSQPQGPDADGVVLSPLDMLTGSAGLISRGRVGINRTIRLIREARTPRAAQEIAEQLADGNTQMVNRLRQQILNATTDEQAQQIIRASTPRTPTTGQQTTGRGISPTTQTQPPRGAMDIQPAPVRTTAPQPTPTSRVIQPQTRTQPTPRTTPQRETPTFRSLAQRRSEQPETTTPLARTQESGDFKTAKQTLRENGAEIMESGGRSFSGQRVFSVKADDLIATDRQGFGDLDEAQVQRVIENLQAGRQIEPLRVDAVDGSVFVEDGKHRLEALRRLGRNEEFVDVIDVTKPPRATAPQTPQPSTPRQATQQADTQATSRATARSQSETPTKRQQELEQQWESDPVTAQAESTRDVAKKYSNTDSNNKFMSDAHNHIDGLPPVTNITAKARNFANKEPVPIDLPDETLGQYLRTQVQDTAFRLGFLQKRLQDSGVKITDDMNAYIQREAYVGRAAARIEKVHKTLGMVAGNKNGILPRMKKDGIDIEMLGEYMAAKNARARNARVKTISKGKVPDGGSGLTNKEADEILNRYKDNPNIARYAGEFRQAVIDERLRILKESGLLTDDQIKLITRYEPDYVPAKVVDKGSRFATGKGFSVSGQTIKGLQGSARKDRSNPVMQAVADLETTIIRSEKNKSLESLGKLIEANPDPSLWSIKGVRHVPQYNQLGEVEFLRPLRKTDDKTIEFWREGKPYEITINDEALAKVFTQQGVWKPVPGLLKVNNYLRAVNTVVNPEFMLTNAVRDLQTALVIAGGEKGIVTAAKMAKDYPKAMSGIWSAVRKESNTGWSKIYNEMVENGGRTGWFDLQEVPEQTKRVSRMINRYNSNKSSDALMRAVDSTGKLVSDLNEVGEMAVRVSAYKQLVDGGLSKVAAANYAKNMTVNFNKRGNLGLTLNSLYLFANAGVQGGARLLMAMKHKKVRRITYGIVGTAYGINELNNKINPEGYERIQDFEKERNLIIMLPKDGNKYNLPGISGDPRTGYYLKIPLPYGFNVFKVAGDIAYDVKNQKKTMTEAMKTMLLAVDASFNPLSSGTPIQFISPTVTDPFVASWENKNWFGAPIMPEQPAFAPPVRQSARYFSGARDLSIWTAENLNRLTGGNQVTAGAIDISPETIDHVIDTLGGGLGNFLASTLDGAVNTVQGDLPAPPEMPFIRKFIDQPFERGEQSQVFDILERSATKRLSNIEIDRFADNTIRAIEMGQIDSATAKRVLTDFQSNVVRQRAGEVFSLLEEGKTDQAIEILESAPPGIAKELNKIIKDDIEKEIKRLESKQ